MSQPITTAFIGNWLSGIFGESLHRYRYDLESGTSYYRNTDGTIDSWQSPQRRGRHHNIINLLTIWLRIYINGSWEIKCEFVNFSHNSESDQKIFQLILISHAFEVFREKKLFEWKNNNFSKWRQERACNNNLICYWN